jgi:hypothetical protein
VKSLSNWRSVRLWETGVERQLRQGHWLWLHGVCIDSIVLGVMWAGPFRSCGELFAASHQAGQGATAIA